MYYCDVVGDTAIRIYEIEGKFIQDIHPKVTETKRRRNPPQVCKLLLKDYSLNKIYFIANPLVCNNARPILRTLTCDSAAKLLRWWLRCDQTKFVIIILPRECFSMGHGFTVRCHPECRSAYLQTTNRVQRTNHYSAILIRGKRGHL